MIVGDREEQGHSSASALPSSTVTCAFGRSQATGSLTIPAPISRRSYRFQLYVYVKNNSHPALITNKVTNSSTKRYALYQISPPYSSSSTAFASPPFPSRPWISNLNRSSFRMLADSKVTRLEKRKKKRTKPGRPWPRVITVLHT